MKLFRVAPFVVGLAGLALVPDLARADVLDCFPPTVTIVSPANDASFEGAPADVTVSVDVQAGGADAALTNVAVNLDGSEAASQSITQAGKFDLQVQVPEGSHELVAVANDDCGGAGTSDPITISVSVSAGGGSASGSGDGSGGDAGSASSGATASDSGGTKKGDEDNGCAIGRTPQRSIVGMSALVLAVLGGWQLRRRR